MTKGNFKEQSKRWKDLLKSLGWSQKDAAHKMGYGNVDTLKNGVAKSKRDTGNFPEHLVRLMNFMDYCVTENPQMVSPKDCVVIDVRVGSSSVPSGATPRGIVFAMDRSLEDSFFESMLDWAWDGSRAVVGIPVDEKSYEGLYVDAAMYLKRIRELVDNSDLEDISCEKLNKIDELSLEAVAAHPLRDR